MTANPIEVLPAEGISIFLRRVEVRDDFTCSQAMEIYADAKRLLKEVESKEDKELYPIERQRALIKDKYKAPKQALKELADFEKDEVARHETAKADLAAATDIDLGKAESLSTEVVRRKVNKVRVLNKELVPEEFKVVDEDKILQAYERLGTVPLGVHASGSFEVYEETVTTLRRKY